MQAKTWRSSLPDTGFVELTLNGTPEVGDVDDLEILFSIIIRQLRRGLPKIHDITVGGCSFPAQPPTKEPTNGPE